MSEDKIIQIKISEECWKLSKRLTLEAKYRAIYGPSFLWPKHLLNLDDEEKAYEPR